MSSANPASPGKSGVGSDAFELTFFDDSWGFKVDGNTNVLAPRADRMHASGYTGMYFHRPKMNPTIRPATAVITAGFMYV